MIHLKTPEEIEIMTHCGKILRETVEELVPQIKEGVTTLFLDEEAERIIIKKGGESSFKKVKGYHWSTCIAVNEQTVHTPPSKRVLKDEDVVTLDIGAFYKGFHTDYATTVVVGGVRDEKVARFLEVGEKALEKGIAKAKANHHLGEISKVIEDEVVGNGYFILKELTGHGVGRELHEDPYVLNYLDRPIEKTYKMRQGLVIAVEVIYSMGTERIAYEKGSNWSIITADHSLSGCFEKTIAITNENTYILT
jgi:methionyl aminopeptidase